MRKILTRIATLSIVGVLSLFLLTSSDVLAFDVQVYGDISPTGVVTLDYTDIGCPAVSGSSGSKVRHLNKTSIVSSDLYFSLSTGTIGDLCSFMSGFNPENYDTGDGTYYIVGTSTISSDVYYMKVYRNSGLWSTDLFPDTTRFISVIPDYASTTATTTVVGATGYINDDDFVSGTYLEVKLENPTLSATGGSALDAWNSSFGVATTLPILSGGLFNASTTLTFDWIGRYNVQYKVKVPNSTPIIGGLLPDQVLVATSSYFTVSTSTWFDERAEEGYQGVVDVLLTGTTTVPILDCNLFDGFDLQKCLISLVIPNSAVLQSDLDLLKDNFLTSFPVGYVTRFIDIVSSGSTTTLPSVVVPLFGNELNLTPWDKLFGDGSILATASSSLVNPVTGQLVGDGDSLRDVFETYWLILWYILLGFAIIHDIIGFGKHNMHKKL